MTQRIETLRVKVTGAPGELGCPSAPDVWYASHFREVFEVFDTQTGYYCVVSGPFKDHLIPEYDCEIV